MPANSTDIVNDALARLGISQITSLNDGSKQAQFATRMYDQTRDEVLALRDWTFAVKRATLSQAASGNSEWLYAYTLPADFLRLVQINNDEIGTIKHKFALEGNKIFTDSTTLAIVYVAEITDVSLYSPLFVECLSIKLASKLAGPLAGDRKMALEFLALFDKVAAMPQPGEQGGRSKRNKNGTLTAVEIANTALAYLGVTPITSLSDNSTQAQLADRFYDVTRDEVLSSRPWSFAIKRASLQRTSNASNSEWAYSYTLPTDYLRLVQLNGDEAEIIQHRYAIEAKKLLSDSSAMDLIYVARITDVSFYSPLFVEAFTLKLAAKLSGPLSAGQPQNNAAQTLLAGYEKAIATPEMGEQRKRSNRAQQTTSSGEVGVVNNALSLLGISPIKSLSDSSATAQMADRFYAATRDEVLSTHPWNFAMKRATLEQGPTPPSQYTHSYVLPADFLRLMQVNGYEVNQSEDDYCVEGQTLLTNASEAKIRYVARVTEVAQWPAIFYEAVSIKLASKMAGPLTQDRTVAASLLQQYDSSVVSKGRLTNAFQNRAPRSDMYAASRYVGSRYGETAYSGAGSLGSSSSSASSTTASGAGLSGAINVTDYGALGNGINDDAPAIRQAIAQALATGKPVYFPGGTYFCATLSTGNSALGNESGQIVFANNQSLTPKRLHIFGHNAEIVVPNTLKAKPGYVLFFLNVTGYFNGVTIDGLSFTHIHSLPTANYNWSSSSANTSNGWPGRLFCLGFYGYMGAHAANVADTERVPSNIYINRCRFTDWTQGVSLWWANNVNISSCEFYHSYGQWTAGNDDWTQFIGGRTVGGLALHNNVFDGFTKSTATVFAAVPSAVDVRCSDGGILISGYGPTGYKRTMITGNVFKNFQREAVGLSHNEYDASLPYTVGNYSDSMVHGAIVTSNYFDGNCPSGVTAAYNAAVNVLAGFVVISDNVIHKVQIGAYVTYRNVELEVAGHYSIISNNSITMPEATRNGMDSRFSRAIIVNTATHCHITDNTIVGKFLGSLNNGWNGQPLQPSDAAVAPQLSAAVHVTGSPGQVYNIGQRPVIYIKDNILLCISTASSNDYSAAFSLNAGAYTAVVENNKVTGWSCLVESRAYSGFKQIVFRRNEVTKTPRYVSGLLHSGQEDITFADHTFVLYPTEVGWHQCRFFNNLIGRASLSIDVLRDLCYGDTTGATDRLVQATQLDVNYVSQNSNATFTVSQTAHSASTSAIVPKIIAGTSGTAPVLAFYVEQLASKAKLLFSGGGGSGASGYATIANGTVQSVTVTSAGSGYTSSPSVEIDTETFRMSGSGALFTANIVSGSVSTVTVNAAGAGYAHPVFLHWKTCEQAGNLAFCPYQIDKVASAPGGKEITLRPGQGAMAIGTSATVGSGLPRTGTSAPSFAPDFVGQLYINTTTPAVYVATGTTSSSNWTQVS